MRERVGVPEEVLAKTPIIDRKRIPSAKVQFRFENGMSTTIIDEAIIDICQFFVKYMNASQKSCHVWGGCLVRFLRFSAGVKNCHKVEKVFDQKVPCLH